MKIMFLKISSARMVGSARLMDTASELRLIRYMWSVAALNIDTFTNSFLMVSIEPGHDVCMKSLH